MKTRLPPMFAILLALMLGLTGQAMAVARGASGPSGELVLCTAAGAVTVQVDDSGQPVGPPHICPDCALNLFHIGAGGPVVLPVPVARFEVLVPVVAQAGHGTAVIPAQARGPPVVI